MTELDRIGRELAVIDSLPLLWGAMLRIYRKEGFTATGYIILSPGDPPQPVAVFASGYPLKLAQAYRDEGLGEADAIPKHVMACGEPMSIARALEEMKPDAEQMAVQQRLDDLGRGEGVVIPLFGPQGRRAFVALGLPADESVMENVDLLKMQAVTQAAHVRMVALTPKVVSDGTCLSRREEEILRWVAQGKSNGVISEILGISIGTVDTYLRRLFQKLDVADRTSAAVKGVSLGLIRI